MRRQLTVDPRIKQKKADIALELPVIIHVTDFTESSAKTFASDMQRAHETEQPVIPIVIDSYGGKVDALMSMMSEIKNAEVPVATICQSKAMSCGSILLTCGTEGYRFMDPNARVMIHDVSNMAGGKTEEIKSDAAETDRLNKMVFAIMAQNCGKEKNYFLNLIHEKAHAEWYLTAKEARRHGIINHIRVPALKIHIGVDINFE